MIMALVSLLVLFLETYGPVEGSGDPRVYLAITIRYVIKTSLKVG